MEEDIADTLLKASDVMHFFGHPRIGNALIFCSRFLRVSKIHTLDELEKWVEEAERNCG